MDTWEAALSGRTDLEQYDDNKLLLFALALHQDIDDIHLVADDALTDASNDKACDLVYVDRETGKVIIAQGYWSQKPGRPAAPSKKASDLNGAASWLLASDLTGLPDALRAAAEELQDALREDEISSIEVWYVHNLPESANVGKELVQVAKTIKSLLRSNFSSASVDSVLPKEVGRQTMETWYRGTKAPILVTATYSLETRGGFRTDGRNWSAYSTSVPASWLYERFQEHGKDLFAANVRDYLGSRRTDKNINHNIKTTARTQPDMFWVYNNGVTALVNDFAYTSQDDAGLLEIRGIAIVNGAQTTGALGSLDGVDLGDAHVPARFVKCSDAETIQGIIRFTNSQNKVEAADFRSNDHTQTRLREEFKTLGGVNYTGGRRGGADDVIRRTRNMISSYSAGQALMAFHGEPATAYNQRSQIWASDALYARIFTDHTTARHILFAYSLLKSVQAAKGNLRTLDESRSGPQERQWEALRQRGASFLVVFAVSAALEVILEKSIANPFDLRFRPAIASIEDAVAAWEPVTQVVLALVPQLAPALSRANLKNKAEVDRAVASFVDMFGAVREPNAEKLSKFIDSLEQT